MPTAAVAAAAVINRTSSAASHSHAATASVNDLRVASSGR
jgi:hypothetical protein